MAEDIFRLPGSSYLELAKIIRAYGHAPDGASPKQVADRAAIDPTQVSRNNAFLLSVGIIEGGRSKSLTERGRSLAKAYDYEIDEEVSQAWHSLAVESDFLRKIVSAVRIRGGMEASALRSHIAYTAGAAKDARSTAGAGSVIDVLRVALLLKEDNGKLIAIADSDRGSEQLAPAGPPASEAPQPATSVPTDAYRLDTLPSATVQLTVNVNCGVEDLDELGPKLAKVIAYLRAQESSTSPDSK